MPRFSKEQLTAYFADIIATAEKIEGFDKDIENATGETREAYVVVHKDLLWKIQKKIGDLWAHSCGIESVNPFEFAKTDA